MQHPLSKTVNRKSAINCNELNSFSHGNSGHKPEGQSVEGKDDKIYQLDIEGEEEQITNNCKDGDTLKGESTGSTSADDVDKSRLHETVRDKFRMRVSGISKVRSISMLLLEKLRKVQFQRFQS